MQEIRRERWNMRWEDQMILMMLMILMTKTTLKITVIIILIIVSWCMPPGYLKRVIAFSFGSSCHSWMQLLMDQKSLARAASFIERKKYCLNYCLTLNSRCDGNRNRNHQQNCMMFKEMNQRTLSSRNIKYQVISFVFALIPSYPNSLSLSLWHHHGLRSREEQILWSSTGNLRVLITGSLWDDWLSPVYSWRLQSNQRTRADRGEWDHGVYFPSQSSLSQDGSAEASSSRPSSSAGDIRTASITIHDNVREKNK